MWQNERALVKQIAWLLAGGQVPPSLPGRGRVLPSLPRPTNSPLTHAAGVHNGSSSDSPSLDRRTVAMNSHPAHSGAPLPGAQQSRF